MRDSQVVIADETHSALRGRQQFPRSEPGYPIRSSLGILVETVNYMLQTLDSELLGQLLHRINAKTDETLGQIIRTAPGATAKTVF